MFAGTKVSIMQSAYKHLIMICVLSGETSKWISSANGKS